MKKALDYRHEQIDGIWRVWELVDITKGTAHWGLRPEEFDTEGDAKTFIKKLKAS